MRGYPDFNFPAFDRARELGRSLGWDIICPAEMDRFFSRETTPEMAEAMARTYMMRDVAALSVCTHIALLPGWQSSVGATAEVAIAKWIKLKFLYAKTFTPVEIPEAII